MIGRLGEVIRFIAWAIEGKDRARPQETKTEKPHAFSRRLSENWGPLDSDDLGLNSTHHLIAA